MRLGRVSWTVLGLLVACAVLALAVPYEKWRRQTRSIHEDLCALDTACTNYWLRNGVPPTSVEDFEQEEIHGRTGEFTWPTDPWDRNYLLEPVPQAGGAGSRVSVATGRRAAMARTRITASSSGTTNVCAAGSPPTPRVTTADVRGASLSSRSPGRP